MSAIYKNTAGNYCRTCWKCGREIEHTGRNSHYNATTANAKGRHCHNCGYNSKAPEKVKRYRKQVAGVYINADGLWCRKCPKCGCECVYRNAHPRQSAITAVKNNQVCLRCRDMSKKKKSDFLPKEDICERPEGNYKVFGLFGGSPWLIEFKRNRIACKYCGYSFLQSIPAEWKDFNFHCRSCHKRNYIVWAN